MAIDTRDGNAPITPAAAPQVRSRRVLLTAALGGLGGLLASRLGAPGPAAAAAGGPLVLGAANSAGTSDTSLTTASAGTALLAGHRGPQGRLFKGKYLNPVEHGKPERLGVDYELRARARRQVAAIPK
jgi:hypothetical protein